jgi:type VI secretion system protein ImpF
LTDEDATLRPAAGQTPTRGTPPSLSAQQYRRSVLRDLSWLLNSQALPADEKVDEFPEVASSVLNYGLPDLASRTIDGLSDYELTRMISRAIQRFEPRIVPQSLSVRVARNKGADRPGTVEVEIEGDVWALPVPERVCFRPEIDLGLGICKVGDR